MSEQNITEERNKVRGSCTSSNVGGTSFHQQTPVPPHMYTLPNKGLKKKKGKGINYVVGFVVLMVVLMIVGTVAISGLFFYIIFSDFGMEPNTTTFETDVILAPGGHYRQVVGTGWEAHIEIEVTSDSERFNTYIMTRDQYENTYREDNDTIMSFSAIHSQENVTEAEQKLDISWEDYTEYLLVIDNLENPITPNDANPTGILTVHLKITTTEDSWD